MNHRTRLLAVGLLLAAPVAGQTIEVAPLDCLPAGSNGIASR